MVHLFPGHLRHCPFRFAWDLLSANDALLHLKVGDCDYHDHPGPRPPRRPSSLYVAHGRAHELCLW